MMIIISPQGQDITGVTWMLCSVLPIQELEFGTLLDILLQFEIWDLWAKLGLILGHFQQLFWLLCFPIDFPLSFFELLLLVSFFFMPTVSFDLILRR